MANQKLKLKLTLALASALLAGHSAAQDATATTTSSAAATVTLPDGFEILERYVDAIGGEKAYRSHKNERMTGSFEMAAMNINGTIVIRPAVVLDWFELELELVVQAHASGVGFAAHADEAIERAGVTIDQQLFNHGTVEVTASEFLPDREATLFGFDRRDRPFLRGMLGDCAFHCFVESL